MRVFLEIISFLWFAFSIKCEKDETAYLDSCFATSAKHGTEDDKEKFGTKKFYQLYTKELTLPDRPVRSLTSQQMLTFETFTK